MFGYRCLSSCSYIKPQPRQLVFLSLSVVYHLVPTSNHNAPDSLISRWALFIILFLHQTTTRACLMMSVSMLFIILFLHQTTTGQLSNDIELPLFIILFLHQTTTSALRENLSTSLFIILFLHQTTTQDLGTSQENCCLSSCSYIKPQRSMFQTFKSACCLSSCSYIKPQRSNILFLLRSVVYHLVPTSNHNSHSWKRFINALFIILFLHQTTTAE